MAPPNLMEQIQEEMKTPKWRISEEVKDFNFWRGVRCEMLGSFLSALFLTLALLNFYSDTIYQKSNLENKIHHENDIDHYPIILYEAKSSNPNSSQNVNKAALPVNLCKIIPRLQIIDAADKHNYQQGLDKSEKHLIIAAIKACLAVMLIQIFGQISGAHTNPAVTLVFLAQNYVSALRCVAYVTATILGNVSGLIMAKLLLCHDVASAFQIPFITLKWNEGNGNKIELNSFQQFGLTCMAAFCLFLVISTCLDPKKIPLRGTLNLVKMSVYPPNQLLDYDLIYKNGYRHEITNRPTKCLEANQRCPTCNYFDNNSHEIQLGRGHITYPFMLGLYNFMETLLLMPFGIFSTNVAYLIAISITTWDIRTFWIWCLGSILGSLMGAFTYEYTATKSSSSVLLADFKRSFRRSKTKSTGNKKSKQFKHATNVDREKDIFFTKTTCLQSPLIEYNY